MAPIEERDHQPDALLVGDFQHFVECFEALFIELAGRQHMDVFPGVGVGAVHAEHVRADDRAAHLPNRFERILDFKFVRPAPGAFAGERERVLN